VSLFLVNVLLALTWAAVTGSFSPANFAFGFVLAAVALWLIREGSGDRVYVIRLWRILALAGAFLLELVLSALRVARLALSPRLSLRPGIIAYPLTVTNDAGIALLANLITLTPGTLSVDVSEDRRTLFIHAVDARDVEGTIASIRSGFERRILEVFG